MSEKILILGNGGVKATRIYNEDDTLKGYVIILQNFDKLITEGVKKGTIQVTENTIETELMTERGLSRLQFAQALGKR